MKSLLLALTLMTLPLSVFAQATAYDYALEQQRGPKEREIAKTYAVAIAVAGACIGAGLYFGLRHSKKDKN
jgi:hypothetical protein